MNTKRQISLNGFVAATVCLVSTLNCTCVMAQRSDAAAKQTAAKQIDDNDPIAQWNRYYENVADGYQLFAGDSQSSLERVKTPALTYTNPTSDRQHHGLIYVWVDRGRPAAMGSIWSMVNPVSNSSRITSHEILSLSESALRVVCPELEGMRAGVLKEWVGQKPSVKWNALPVANMIGKANATTDLSSTQVQRVLRRAAVRFDGETIRRRDQLVRKLRLLRTPIFQYESDSKQQIGSLFAFAEATDPEIILWLEYQRPEKTNPQSSGQWRYSIGRMSITALNLKLDGKQVWSQPPAINRSAPTYNVQYRVCEFPDGKAPTN